MWICPSCGEKNEDHFQTCWKCTSEVLREQTPTAGELPPQQVRSLGSVLGRAAIGGIVGMLVGALAFHRLAPLEAAVSSATLGAVAAGGVGFFFWVVFPYEPRRRGDAPDTDREAD